MKILEKKLSKQNLPNNISELAPQQKLKCHQERLLTLQEIIYNTLTILAFFNREKDLIYLFIKRL